MCVWVAYCSLLGSVRAPGPYLQKEWVSGISSTFNNPHPLSSWSFPFLGNCGWREGERQLESLQAFLKGCPWEGG